MKKIYIHTDSKSFEAAVRQAIEGKGVLVTAALKEASVVITDNLNPDFKLKEQLKDELNGKIIIRYNFELSGWTHIAAHTVSEAIELLFAFVS